MDIEDRIETAQLALLQSSKDAQEETINMLQVNSKLKCYELAIQHVSTMNCNNSLSTIKISDEITKKYNEIAKLVKLS